MPAEMAGIRMPDNRVIPVEFSIFVPRKIEKQKEVQYNLDLPPVLKTTNGLVAIYRQNRIFASAGGRTKPPILNETKQPILKTGQNGRFRKRQNRRFWSGTKQPIFLSENIRFFFCLYLNSNEQNCKTEMNEDKLHQFNSF